MVQFSPVKDNLHAKEQKHDVYPDMYDVINQHYPSKEIKNTCSLPKPQRLCLLAGRAPGFSGGSDDNLFVMQETQV